MLFLHELKLKSLETQAKARPKALIFFDPIAEGLYEEAIYASSPKPTPLFDFLKLTPKLEPTSAQYVVLQNGTVLHHNTSEETRGNYGLTKTLKDGTILHRRFPEENANGRH